MGSSLVDRHGKEVWSLRRGGILRALATLGGSIRGLTLPPDHTDGPAPDGVTAKELLPGLHMIPGLWTPVEGYAALERFLRLPRHGLIDDNTVAGGPPGNLIVFPYDWRLSNRWSGELLKQRVETALARWRDSAADRRGAKVVFVCHSMGGLVARWYLERLGGHEIARALVTLGTPHRGALKSLDQLVNGVRKGFGPIGFDFTGLARSLPSTYELLPAYACVEGPDGTLAKTTEVSLPGLETARVQAGMRFHDELRAAAVDSPILPIVGIGQPTATTARIADERLQPLGTIKGKDRAGDGTVPRLSALPEAMSERDPAIRGVADGHGALTGNRSVLDQLDFLLSAEEIAYRGVTLPEPVGTSALGVSVPDLHQVGEGVRVVVHSAVRRVLEAIAFDEGGRPAASGLIRFGEERDSGDRSLGEIVFDGLGPGGYVIAVGTPDNRDELDFPPVRSATLVWNP